MPDEPRFRRAGASDVPALAALYAHSARALGPGCYTPQQVQAWARFPADATAFGDYILRPRTWMLVTPDGAPLGFCGIEPGHVAGTGPGHTTAEVDAAAFGEVRSLYVAASATRRGLGTRLLVHALQDAERAGLRRFQAWVTPLSRPVFERQGFRLVRTVTEPFEGVLFERYRVERDG